MARGRGGRGGRGGGEDQEEAEDGYELHEIGSGPGGGAEAGGTRKQRQPSAFFSDMAGEPVEHAHIVQYELHPELDEAQWETIIDDDNSVYYWDRVTDETTRLRPRSLSKKSGGHGGDDSGGGGGGGGDDDDDELEDDEDDFVNTGFAKAPDIRNRQSIVIADESVLAELRGQRGRQSGGEVDEADVELDLDVSTLPELPQPPPNKPQKKQQPEMERCPSSQAPSLSEDHPAMGRSRLRANADVLPVAPPKPVPHHRQGRADSVQVFVNL
jgi:hypothetical protein